MQQGVYGKPIYLLLCKPFPYIPDGVKAIKEKIERDSIARDH